MILCGAFSSQHKVGIGESSSVAIETGDVGDGAAFSRLASLPSPIAVGGAILGRPDDVWRLTNYTQQARPRESNGRAGEIYDHTAVAVLPSSPMFYYYLDWQSFEIDCEASFCRI